MKKFLFLLGVSAFFFSCVTEEKEEEKVSSVIDTTKSATANTSDTSFAPTTSFVYGIDISKYQGDEIDFINKKQDTLSFVICKATQGLTLKDPDFQNNWNVITKKGFIRGAYHFYQTQDDPVKQAQFFLSVVDSFSKQGFAPIIDFEESSISNTLTIPQIQNNLLAFLRHIEQRTGRTPIIYTDNNTGERYLNHTAFATYPLFIADYRNASSPRLPGAWKDKHWWLWQKSESYMLHSTQDDFDVFNGGMQELQIFISNH